ncbi:MAG: biotin/lipoyl-binding protein [Clostridia bacterium]|nr:biotin/lipoyl-binding protein [Clostridia bacterium]
MKKGICVLLTLVLVMSLAACSGGNTAVTVQRADRLMSAGVAGERYAGVVVSNNVVEINRDSSKRIEELYVGVGDTVSAGDKLFSYDSDELELSLEKAQLEVEKMTNEQTDYTAQLEKLEKKLNNTWNESDKVRLTLEINTLKTTLMETEYNLKAKDKEIATLTEMLSNIDILSPVDGTVRKVDEEGQSGSFITVQQSGAYRVQGMLNEMSMGSGLMSGSRVQIFSRVNDDTWTGTVTSVNTSEVMQDSNMNMGFVGGAIAETMTTTSSYVFDVELDSVDGLLLGQHVYIELMQETAMTEGLWIPENFLVNFETDEETFELSATVFAENGSGKLEERSVALGMYDGMTGCYEILSGVSAEDYIADPFDPGCVAGASVMRREPEDFTGTGTEMPAEGDTVQEDVVVEDGTAQDEMAVDAAEIVTEE